jgi:hypothetical protein
MNFIIKFFQCFFCWRVKVSPEEKIKSADVILGQSFGLRKNDSGTSNRQMAKIAQQIFEQYGISMALQWEIADCLPYLPKTLIVREHRIKGKYLDTFEVLSQMWEFCKEKSWKRAIILAHPDHYWRCWMVAKMLGFIPISIDVSSVKYDPESIQEWTKSARKFIPYDVAARIWLLITGKI